MAYRKVIDATAYVFDDLRELLAKATPPRSGDRLAGIAAGSAEEMIAARMALADTPLKQFVVSAGNMVRHCRAIHSVVMAHPRST